MGRVGRRGSVLPRLRSTAAARRRVVRRDAPADALEQAEAAARECDVLLVAGTSAEVYPAAALPMYARQSGAAVVEINTAPTEMSAFADYVLRGPSGVTLPALLSSLGEPGGSGAM